MPALTRGRARQLRAEGKQFQDPSQLGKKAPPDPPQISKPKRPVARTSGSRAAANTGAKVKKAGRKGGKKKTAKTSTRKGTGGKASAAAADEDPAHEDREYPDSSSLPQTDPPLPAEEATHEAGEIQELPPGPATNDPSPADPYQSSSTTLENGELENSDQDPGSAAIGSSAGGVHSDEATQDNPPEDSEQQSPNDGATVREAGIGEDARRDSSETTPPPLTLIRLTSGEAQARGGLETPNVRIPTLTNDIHDIWDPGHGQWRFDQQLGYEDDFFTNEEVPSEDRQWRILDALSPAMRLASIWLTRPEYWDFWGTILYGRSTFDEQSELWDLEPVEMTAERANGLEERLRDIATRHHFIFEMAMGDQGEQLAVTEVINREEPLTWRGREFAPGYVTSLSPDFLSAVWTGGSQGSFRSWDDNTTCERLRYFFFLAVTLGGQMAELLWMDRCRRETGDEDAVRDPRIRIHGELPYSDLRLAFQESFLGGRLEAVELGAPEALSGLGLMMLDGVVGALVEIDNGVVGSNSEFEIAVVLMEGISQRFSAEWWANAELGRATETLPVAMARGRNVHYTLF
ncbi:MAG: hypothetical protein L6R40_006827 [Gallowayella cf. fulva]|nr:MAG: hypothetical protein L6R40_006827 [Xanthomendoza cf. fulva]